MSSPGRMNVEDECMGFEARINSHDADVMAAVGGKAVVEARDGMIRRPASD